MSKIQKNAGTTTNANADTVSDEQAQNIADLNAKQDADKKADVAPKEPTLDELKQAAADAGTEYANAIMSGDADKQAESGKKLLSAKRALDEYNNKIAAELAQKEQAEKMQHSFDIVTSVLGVSRETIDTIVKSFTPAADANDADKKTALETSNAFKHVFGSKPIIAKEGQTGANLAASTSRKGTGAEILSLWKDGDGLAAADIIAKGYSRGTTHAVILERKRELGLAPKKD